MKFHNILQLLGIAGLSCSGNAFPVLATEEPIQERQNQKSELELIMSPIPDLVYNQIPIPLRMVLVVPAGVSSEGFQFDPRFFELTQYGSHVEDYTITSEVGFENGMRNGVWEGWLKINSSREMKQLILRYPVLDNYLSSNNFHSINMNMKTIQMDSMDLVFDSKRNVFYVATSQYSEIAPNSIAILDKDLMEVVGQVGADLSPSASRNWLDLDIDPDGQFLYASSHNNARFEVYDLNDPGTALFTHNFDPLGTTYSVIAKVLPSPDGIPRAIFKMRNRYGLFEGGVFKELDFFGENIFFLEHRQSLDRWLGGNYNGDVLYEFERVDDGFVVKHSWESSDPVSTIGFLGDDHFITFDLGMASLSDPMSREALSGLPRDPRLILQSESRDTSAAFVVGSEEDGISYIHRYSAGSVVPDIKFMSPLTNSRRGVQTKVLRWGNRGVANMVSYNGTGKLEILESPLFMEPLPPAEIVGLDWLEGGAPRLAGETFQTEVKLVNTIDESNEYLYVFNFNYPPLWQYIENNRFASRSQYLNFRRFRFVHPKLEFKVSDESTGVEQMNVKLVRIEEEGVRLMEEIAVDIEILDPEASKRKVFINYNHDGEIIVSGVVESGKSYQLQYWDLMYRFSFRQLLPGTIHVETPEGKPGLRHWLVESLHHARRGALYRLVEVE